MTLATKEWNPAESTQPRMGGYSSRQQCRLKCRMDVQHSVQSGDLKHPADPIIRHDYIQPTARP
jgi:hypothetical protein